MATESQINANRKNAESSTGPSQTGKARSCMNAVKTGLTARIMIQPRRRPNLQNSPRSLFRQILPANPDEHDLVQTIADTEWRLADIPPLERGIYTTGRDKCAHLVEHIQDPTQRAARSKPKSTYSSNKTSSTSPSKNSASQRSWKRRLNSKPCKSSAKKIR